MKKIILPLIALTIGFVLGYFTYYYLLKHELNNIGKHKFTGTTSDNAFLVEQQIRGLYDEQAFKFSGGTHPIDPIEANNLITQFRNENETSGHLFPLRCWDQQALRGFFIDKKFLKTIVDDQSNIGVSLYFAKDSTAHSRSRYDMNTNRIYTLVYMGAKKKTSTASNSTEDRSIKYGNSTISGTMYDFIDPCPDACGDFTQKMQQQISQASKHKRK